MPVIRVSDDLFARLQRHAVPLTDSATDVISRILDCYEQQSPPDVSAKAIGAPFAKPEFSGFGGLWDATAEEFNKLSPRAHATPGGTAYYKPVRIGLPNVHYEWSVRSRVKRMDVCLHFEFEQRAESLRRLAEVAAHEAEIRKGIELEYSSGAWGRKWAQMMFRVPFLGDFPSRNTVAQAATTMKMLMDRTLVLLKEQSG